MFKFIIVSIILFCNFNDTKVIKTSESIDLGGVTLFKVKGPKATERSQIIYDRLRSNLVPSLESGDITVGLLKGQSVVMINDDVLVTITVDDAKFNKSTAVGLANKIQKRLSQILPALTPLDKIN